MGTRSCRAGQGSVRGPAYTCSQSGAHVPGNGPARAADRLGGAGWPAARGSAGQGGQQTDLMLTGLRTLSADGPVPLLNMDPIVMVTK